jgi:acetyl-CoA carboxylase biotin carboxyl carrier protein
MATKEEDILQILDFVEASSFDEFELETGDLKLVVRKHARGTSGKEADAVPLADVAPLIDVKPDTLPGRAVEHPAPTPVPAKADHAPATERDGLIPIKAPMLGVVYRRPGPESPPFVEIGSHVKAGDTVCLIEIMKTFNAVKADVSGRIVEVLFNESIMVERGQTLFLAKPDAASS